jgi:hypothetical protein
MDNWITTDEAAKEMYPTESAIKNMFHDNSGQYSRQKAFQEGAEWSKKMIMSLLMEYWRFDNNQQHLSSWHDKQDFIEKIESIHCKPIIHTQEETDNWDQSMDN